MHHVTELRVLEAYLLELRFEDQTVKVVDLRPFLGQGISAQLMNDTYFREVEIDSGGGIVWPNGYDFCPNFLYEDVPAVDLVHY